MNPCCVVVLVVNLIDGCTHNTTLCTSTHVHVRIPSLAQGDTISLWYPHTGVTLIWEGGECVLVKHTSATWSPRHLRSWPILPLSSLPGRYPGVQSPLNVHAYLNVFHVSAISLHFVLKGTLRLPSNRHSNLHSYILHPEHECEKFLTLCCMRLAGEEGGFRNQLTCFVSFTQCLEMTSTLSSCRLLHVEVHAFMALN